MALTVQDTGAALVGGAALPQRTVRVRVLRPFMLDGAPLAVKDEVELPAVFAREMVAANKAVAIEAQPPAPAAPAEPAPKADPKPDTRRDTKREAAKD
jgi:hypothetical protein